MNLRFRQLPAAEQADLPMAPYDRWLTGGGEVSALFHRSGANYLLRLCDQADFLIDLDREEVTCTPVPDMPDEAVFDLYFNQVIPLVLSRNGQLVLHASGVLGQAGALAFVGATGRGKSTLAAAFARAGYPFITDDGLILEDRGNGYDVIPRRPILRLRPDSRAEILAESADPRAEIEGAAQDRPKDRVPARPEIPFHAEPAPLAAIYILGESRSPERPQITPMTPAEALGELIRHSFMLDVDNRPLVRGHFHRIAELAARQSCFHLDFNREYNRLAEVIRFVSDHASGGVQPS